MERNLKKVHLVLFKKILKNLENKLFYFDFQLKLDSIFKSEEIETLITTDTNYLTDFSTSNSLEVKRSRFEILTPRLSAALDKYKFSDKDSVHLLTIFCFCFAKLIYTESLC